MPKNLTKRLEKIEDPIERQAQNRDRVAIRSYQAYLALQHWHLEQRRPEVATEYERWIDALHTTKVAILGRDIWEDWEHKTPSMEDVVDATMCDDERLYPLYDELEKVNEKIDLAIVAGDIPLVPDEELLEKAARRWRVPAEEVRKRYELRVLEALLIIKEREHGVDLEASPPVRPPAEVIEKIAAETGLAGLELYYSDDHDWTPADVRGY